MISGQPVANSAGAYRRAVTRKWGRRSNQSSMSYERALGGGNDSFSGSFSDSFCVGSEYFITDQVRVQEQT